MSLPPHLKYLEHLSPEVLEMIDKAGKVAGIDRGDLQPELDDIKYIEENYPEHVPNWMNLKKVTNGKEIPE